ncbi:hypothetical protein Bca52824_036637 [Brassica carinata]|uniref:Uncharacterized protein n=1 Tax=Brassica carinata TaxID=52824 RepID=A0A8X7V1Q5_BRACI|nr:hypothetical protein Bca52824_036637 [Brassica carinata]
MDIISSPSNSSVKLPSINGSSSPNTVGDISIRDPLVKQADWSYLQATAQTSSEESAVSIPPPRVASFSARVQLLRPRMKVRVATIIRTGSVPTSTRGDDGIPTICYRGGELIVATSSTHKDPGERQLRLLKDHQGNAVSVMPLEKSVFELSNQKSGVKLNENEAVEKLKAQEIDAFGIVRHVDPTDIISSPSNSSVKLPSINGSSSPNTVGDISIRDPLVKQADWSYLQATAQTSSEESAVSIPPPRVASFSARVQLLRRVKNVDEAVEKLKAQEIDAFGIVRHVDPTDIISSPSNSSVKLPSINGSSSPNTVGDISIRDPLVKQADWSYLQATAQTSSEESAVSIPPPRVASFSARVQLLRRVVDWFFYL